MPYLNDESLERSGVVANCQMNRERSLTGSNGYTKELGFNPLDVLREKADSSHEVAWLDLCCGSGKALVEAARIAETEGIGNQIKIVGVDLVGSDAAAGIDCLTLIEASLTRWQPNCQFDVITCVHGLHYIGDKLGLIARVASWLTDQGRFTANLDLTNVQVQNCSRSSRIVGKELRRIGIEYDGRKRLVTCVGRKAVSLPLRYLGADDEAGPNCTGQPAVHSHYEQCGQVTP